jgi:hypothetical protein
MDNKTPCLNTATLLLTWTFINAAAAAAFELFVKYCLVSFTLSRVNSLQSLSHVIALYSPYRMLTFPAEPEKWKTGAYNNFTF